MLAERSVGTVGVVVLDVFGEHGLQVVATEDEHPVEALAPDGADHALADGLGAGCPGAGVQASKRRPQRMGRILGTHR